MAALPLRHPSTLDFNSFANGRLDAYRQILAVDERHREAGQPLLTDAGVCYVRQVLASLCSGGSDRVEPLLPHWDGEQLQLWMGAELLATFGHRESYMSMILTAFQKAGWASRRVADPLPRKAHETDGDARRRLHSTVRNLNSELHKRAITFHVETGHIWWDFRLNDDGASV